MSNEFTLNTQPLVGKLKDIRPLTVRLVNKASWEQVWDYLVKNYHYLGYETMIGPRIKYLVFHKNRPIAALSYNRAVLRLGVRDTFLGWTPEQKRLVGAALTRDPVKMRRALSELMYHMRRNFVAYRSHRKTKMRLLNTG